MTSSRVPPVPSDKNVPSDKTTQHRKVEKVEAIEKISEVDEDQTRSRKFREMVEKQDAPPLGTSDSLYLIHFHNVQF